MVVVIFSLMRGCSIDIHLAPFDEVHFFAVLALCHHNHPMQGHSVRKLTRDLIEYPVAT